MKSYLTGGAPTGSTARSVRSTISGPPPDGGGVPFLPGAGDILRAALNMNKVHKKISQKGVFQFEEPNLFRVVMRI